MSGMLQGRSDSQQQQLLDVFAFHVIPQLPLQDALALSHTCSSLWTLMQTGLPDTTYSSLASNTCPPYRPLLAVNNSGLQAAIRKLSAVHIRSGRIASSATCFLHGLCDRGPHRISLGLSHHGEYWLSEQKHEMQLHRLHMEGHDLTMVPVWTRPLLEDPSSHTFSKIFWSPDDTWALILHAGRYLRTAYDAMDTHDGNTYVMHTLEISTQAVAEIVQRATPDAQHTLRPLPSFGSDGNHVLIQWDGRGYNDVDIYSHKERKMVFSFRDTDGWNWVPETPIVGFAFAPDCSLFAIVSREVFDDGVCIHVIDCQSKRELWRQRIKVAQRYASFGWWQDALLAWSPNGSQIAWWLSNSNSRLCVFDAKHGHFQVSVNVETVSVNPSHGVGLWWGLYSPLPILWSVDPRNWAYPRSDSCSILICGVPGNECPAEHVLVQIGNCPPAFSPDCMFLAVLDPEGTAVCTCVYDATSGICVSRQEVDIDVTRPSAVSLVWEPLARGLVLQISYYSSVDSFVAEHQTLSVLRF